MTALARDAADRLVGTCQGLYTLGPEYEAALNDQDFCTELDDHVFLCSCCGWWCDPSEMVSDDAFEPICGDCI